MRLDPRSVEFVNLVTEPPYAVLWCKRRVEMPRVDAVRLAGKVLRQGAKEQR